MKVQRKIRHLLESKGTGRDFAYLKRINPSHGFIWDKEFWVTDKIDGTTVQANNKGIFKRMDVYRKGDPRKRLASEEERYKLLGIFDYQKQTFQNHWKLVIEAIKPYLKNFQKLPENITVYFEAFGERINSRYRGIKKHDIRVFDIAIDENFRPFKETISFCKESNLPIVGYKLESIDVAKNIERFFDSLRSAIHSDKALSNFPLEGWVIRQFPHIAKIRKLDLKKVMKSL